MKSNLNTVIKEKMLTVVSAPMTRATKKRIFSSFPKYSILPMVALAYT
jgi:hypothetical protein